jgi:hypothetical protein
LPSTRRCRSPASWLRRWKRRTRLESCTGISSRRPASSCPPHG